MANLVTSISEEVLSTGGANNVRTTEVAAEALTSGGVPKVRATTLAMEVLSPGQSNNRITELALEVLMDVTAAPAGTSPVLIITM